GRRPRSTRSAALALALPAALAPRTALARSTALALARRPVLVLARASLEPGDDLRELGRLAQRADRPLEQLGLALHQPGALLERAPGALQRFGLPVQRCAGLLEQVEDGVDRREQASRQVRLEPALAVDYLLHELE